MSSSRPAPPAVQDPGNTARGRRSRSSGSSSTSFLRRVFRLGRPVASAALDSRSSLSRSSRSKASVISSVLGSVTRQRNRPDTLAMLMLGAFGVAASIAGQTHDQEQSTEGGAEGGVEVTIEPLSPFAEEDEEEDFPTPVSEPGKSNGPSDPGASESTPASKTITSSEAEITVSHSANHHGRPSIGSQDQERTIQGAQTIKGDDAIMIDSHNVNLGAESGGKATKLLQDRKIPGANFDSTERYPFPRWHPSSRKGLRDWIITWLTNPQRDRRMLWVMDPSGAGKSAVAQAIAEQAQSMRRLGAAFFFSRLNGCNDTVRVIPTIAHQLAIQYPHYRNEIADQLVNDPTILDKSLSIQLNQLIIKPFAKLKERQSPEVEQPLLIILDGLDECEGEEAQCEFIELIGEHVRLVDNFPLIWMICSRPVPHLKNLLTRADFPIRCPCKELPVDDAEIQPDGIEEVRRHSTLDERLLVLLGQVFKAPHKRKAMQGLQNNRAQIMIDFLNAILSQSEFTSLQLSKKHTLIALYRLCKSSQLYPQLYVLQDISIEPIQDGGGFCDIHKGRHGDQELCLKVVRLFQKREQVSMLKAFAKEAILWGQLVHPNILPFYGVYHLDEASKRICLVSPWMKKGNLVRYLDSNPLIPRLPLVYDIINGLDYLHKENVVHGDLKGANILVMDSGRACIADFGLSTVLDHSLPAAAATSTLLGGTYRWSAPELLNGSNAHPSRASDIWAFGGVCYQILTRLLPYHECVADGTVIGKILGGDKSPRVVADPKLDKVDNEMWDMMERCWALDRQSRPTCEQLIREFDLKRFADKTGEDGHDERFALENARFRNAMRKKSDVQIDLVGIEQVLNEL